MKPPSNINVQSTASSSTTTTSSNSFLDTDGDVNMETTTNQHFNLAGIERFDSKTDVSSWLRAMDALYKISNVNDNFFTVRVALHMEKIARDWSLRHIDDLETKNILTWKKFAQDFKEQFAKADDEFEL
ncbi:hypothetical protein BX616_009008, partial [Lobosporangium transversale]